ncbi:hypothetical protein V1477_020297 [Vespula maculifrons]|uniref:Uncharacterized protein n=1 Tax=Vespula maculifrons TaxID=7453 RepID=A0ABD2AMC5_VESMC
MRAAAMEATTRTRTETGWRGTNNTLASLPAATRAHPVPQAPPPPPPPPPFRLRPSRETLPQRAHPRPPSSSRFFISRSSTLRVPWFTIGRGQRKGSGASTRDLIRLFFEELWFTLRALDRDEPFGQPGSRGTSTCLRVYNRRDVEWLYSWRGTRVSRRGVCEVRRGGF